MLWVVPLDQRAAQVQTLELLALQGAVQELPLVEVPVLQPKQRQDQVPRRDPSKHQ